MHVTGIGQSSWDYLLEVDSYPEVDTKKELLNREEQGGGPVATALVALSHLGLSCSFYGITGDDGEGEKIRQSLSDETIDIRGLKIREVSSSQIASIIVEKSSGKRTILWKRPDGRELETSELGDGFLDGTEFLLLDGLMKEVSIYAANESNNRKIPVMVDAGRIRDGMLDLCAVSDYVVGSEEFAIELGWDGNAVRFQQAAKKLGLGVVTITLGEKGSVTYYNDEIIEAPPFKVDVVDTTGAGDVFHGGYIYGILQGWEIRKTITFASAFAALKCRKRGGRKGIASLDEVISFIEA